MDRVNREETSDELSLSAPNGENGSTPRLAPSPPLRPCKDSPALLELEGSLSRDSLQSGGHSSEAVDTGSEGVCVSHFTHYLVVESESRIRIRRVEDPSPLIYFVINP